MDKLHLQIVRIIKAYTGEVPEGMKAVWDWEHERMMEKSTKIRTLIELIKK